MNMRRSTDRMAAKVGLIAALLAASLVFLLTGLLDPFGRREAAIREAVALSICSDELVYERRLSFLMKRVAQAGGLDRLGPGDQDLVIVLREAIDRTNDAQKALRIRCKEEM